MNPDAALGLLHHALAQCLQQLKGLLTALLRSDLTGCLLAGSFSTVTCSVMQHSIKHAYAEIACFAYVPAWLSCMLQQVDTVNFVIAVHCSVAMDIVFDYCRQAVCSSSCLTAVHGFGSAAVVMYPVCMIAAIESIPIGRASLWRTSD